MPVYEYRCPTCHDRFELLRSFSQADQPAICPSGHVVAERLVSMPAARVESGGPLPMAGASGGGGGACCGGGCCA
ncbi:MAG TPA: zinc ribbon domain-containing protein [Nitriliruptorales bacterium]